VRIFDKVVHNQILIERYLFALAARHPVVTKSITRRSAPNQLVEVRKCSDAAYRVSPAATQGDFAFRTTADGDADRDSIRQSFVNELKWLKPQLAPIAKYDHPRRLVFITDGTERRETKDMQVDAVPGCVAFLRRQRI
jgi:hypothetical protein